MLMIYLNPKKTGLFWRLVRLGGGGHDGPPWDLGRGSRDRRENLHNGSVRCNLQNYTFRFSKKVFYYFILINYANLCKIQTFCSKSVNEALKMLIFGILFVAFLAIVLGKNSGIKINFLCILLFYEFLM